MATLTKTNGKKATATNGKTRGNDHKVKDLSLAEWGRKEISVAEQEMPGLMAVREKYGAQKPLNGVSIWTDAVSHARAASPSNNIDSSCKFRLNSSNAVVLLRKIDNFVAISRCWTTSTRRSCSVALKLFRVMFGTSRMKLSRNFP